jgi:hypothetical protein
MSAGHMVVTAAKKLCEVYSDACGIDNEDNWKIYGDGYLSDATEVLNACGALSLVQALQDLIEAAQSMAGTCGVIRGDTPEDADIHTHDDWAEKFLAERTTAALAAVAKATGVHP